MVDFLDQPSVFWTWRVWEVVGALDATLCSFFRRPTGEGVTLTSKTPWLNNPALIRRGERGCGQEARSVGRPNNLFAGSDI